MSAPDAIDFARSSCTWLLPEQPSHGRYAIDASLRLADGETFYLCAQVFAGHVYGDADLIQDPPYEFSAAFSGRRYRIFRDAARGPAAADSCGAVAERFRELRLDIVRAACAEVPPGEVSAVPAGALSARIRLGDAELEFPVRHFNWRASDGRFQVETGPLLVAIEGSGEPEARLRRAYVAFGALDRVHFLLDEPRGGAPGQRWGRRLALACATSLLRLGPQ